MTMDDDHGCRDVLLNLWKAVHDPGEPLTDITVSTAPPLVANPFTEGYTCPHGTSYWIEPTGDQIARWKAEARNG